MFGNKSKQDHEQAIALLALVGSLASTTAGGKGRGAERLESMAQVVAALGIDASTIKSVAIDWRTIRVENEMELVPVLKLESADNQIKEIQQTEIDEP